MAVRKATRSKSTAQPQPQNSSERTKTAHAAGSPENAEPKLPDRQRRAELFETLRHLNRGYGVALAALDRLALKDRYRPRPIFPASLINDYRVRTEGLQALANHDLLLVYAGREEEEARKSGDRT